MRKSLMPLCGIGLAAALCGAQPLRAQDATPKPADAAPAIDPASIEVPDLAFRPDADAEGNYDKYFYFHRADTDFATAYADIQECDGYARGLSYHTAEAAVGYPYAGTVGGAVGGAIGNAMADAIFGSAERRKQRRTNMRRCMGFKDYKVYGLPKEIWTKFNFEEGLSHVEEDKRQRLLQIQAKVASGPTPRVGEIIE